MKRSVGARLMGAFTNLLLLVAFGFGAMMLVPTVLGMHHYVILTGSMTGTYDRGSIIFDKPVPTKQLRVGDPITYSPPPGQTAHSEVTHRINRITHGRDGLRIYGTKGDANRVQDPWTFRLPQPTQDKVVWHVPYAGYALGVLSDRKYRMYLLGIPALLVALSVIRGLWRDSREVECSEAAGWGDGDIAEPTHAAQPLSADASDVAAVFVTLSDGARPGAQRRRAAAARPAQARGPRIARLMVSARAAAPPDDFDDVVRDVERACAGTTAPVAGFVALADAEPGDALPPRAASRRSAVARGPRVPHMDLPHLH